MAFNIALRMMGEYRGKHSGVSSKGNQWLSLLFEDEDCNQLSVSVPKDMIGDVYNLHMAKGEFYWLAVRAVARADGNSYVMLQALPSLGEGDDE